MSIESPANSVEAARNRIQAAYDPEAFTLAGRQFVETLTDHFATMPKTETPVLNWALPWENIERATAELRGDPVAHDPKSIAGRFTELMERMLSRGHNLHNPRYVGHQVPASIPLAGLFDAIGAVTNQVMAIYEMGPWSTAVEDVMVQQLGQLIGWKSPAFSGLVTHGGSLANLTALLTARNVTLGDSWDAGVSAYSERLPVLISHAEAHYCIARSAGILGLGTKQVLKAHLDDKRRIDPNRLDETLKELRSKGIPIIAVAACGCATPVGAFDPLADIAEVCQKHEVWLHVDAAHGGAVLFSDRHRGLLEGIDQADSLICDAHKMLFVPALCAFVFYKNAEHRLATFQQDAPYLFDPSAPDLADYDVGLKTVECTKRSAAYGLWGVWSMFGAQLFGDLVDVTFDLGRQFYEKLCEADDFESLHDPQCNIVVFRHCPEWMRNASPEKLGEFQLRLRRSVIESGEFYLVPTAHNGIGALRVTFMNPLTTSDHLDLLLNTLREHGERLQST